MIYQWEVWHECNTGCVYCFNGHSNGRTPDCVKVNSLKSILKTLDDENFYKTYSKVGLIGGEFFQGQLSTPEISSLFSLLIQKINDKLTEGKLKELWLTASLCTDDFSDFEDLSGTMDILQDNISKVWICTSYDTWGRFTTNTLVNWEENVAFLKDVYNVNINCSMIVTQDLVSKYLNNEFNFTEFKNKFGVELSLKRTSIWLPKYPPDDNHNMTALERERWGVNYLKGDYPEFFVNRPDMLKFLTKLAKTEPNIFIKTFNIEYRADALQRNFNDGSTFLQERDKVSKKEIKDSDTLSCGHDSFHALYSDCDNCIQCDREMIAEAFELK